MADVSFLCDDTLGLIFSFVSPGDAWLIGLVCKRFRSVSMSLTNAPDAEADEERGRAIRPLDHAILRAVRSGGTATVRMVSRKPSCVWKMAFREAAVRNDVAMLDVLSREGRLGTLAMDSVLSNDAVRSGSIDAAEYIIHRQLGDRPDALNRISLTWAISSGRVEMLDWVLSRNESLADCFASSTTYFLGLAVETDSRPMFDRVSDAIGPRLRSTINWNAVLEKAANKKANSLFAHMVVNVVKPPSSIDWDRITRTAVSVSNIGVLNCYAGLMLKQSAAARVDDLAENNVPNLSNDDSLRTIDNLHDVYDRMLDGDIYAYLERSGHHVVSPTMMEYFVSVAALSGDVQSLGIVRKSDGIKKAVVTFAKDTRTMDWFRAHADLFEDGPFDAVWWNVHSASMRPQDGNRAI